MVASHSGTHNKKPRKPTSKGSSLSAKERLFVSAFYGAAKANASKAAALAGYAKASAGQTGYKLLKKAQVQAALAALSAKRDTALIADAELRDQTLSAILLNSSEVALARIAAAKELNKCEGRHSVTHILKGKLTLEQAIAASRRLP